MSDIRCAACGSKNVEIVEGKYKCNDCHFTLSFPMNEELCNVIGDFISSDGNETMININNRNVSWQYFRKKYNNLEHCKADDLQAIIDKPRLHDGEAAIQYLSKLVTDARTGEDYELSLSKESLDKEQLVWQEQVAQNSLAVGALVEKEIKTINEKHIADVKRLNEDLENSQAAYKKKTAEINAEIEEAQNRLKSISVFKVNDKLAVKEEISAIEKELSSVKEEKRADYILKTGRIEAEEKKYKKKLQNPEKAVMKRYSLSISPVERVESIKAKRSNENVDNTEVISKFLPDFLKYYGKATADEMRIVFGTFLKTVTHDNWTVVSGSRIENIIKTEFMDKIDYEKDDKGNVYYYLSE